MYLGCSITKVNWKLRGSAVLHFRISMTSLENNKGLISYIFCNNFVGLFKWSREMLHKILDFAYFDSKLWSTVTKINKVHLRFVVWVVFCGLMGFWGRWFFLGLPPPTKVRKRQTALEMADRKSIILFNAVSLRYTSPLLRWVSRNLRCVVH